MRGAALCLPFLLLALAGCATQPVVIEKDADSYNIGQQLGRFADQIVERTPRGKTRYVLVPDSVATLDYADLVDVDPATLDPTAVPEAAWWAAWQAMAAGTYLVHDPAHPGLYLAATGSSMTPDPALDGLYTIGVPA